jgi:hypothetical protein
MIPALKVCTVLIDVALDALEVVGRARRAVRSAAARHTCRHAGHQPCWRLGVQQGVDRPVCRCCGRVL